MADRDAGILVEWFDRVCLAAVYTLRAAPPLATFFEDRIYRVGASIDDDAPDTRQELAVAIGPGRFDPQPSGIEIVAPIFVRIVWTETRRILEDDEPSIASIVPVVLRALLTNYHLVRPETGGVPLVRRIESIQDVDVRAIRREGDAVTFSQISAVEYRTFADANLEPLDV